MKNFRILFAFALLVFSAVPAAAETVRATVRSSDPAARLIVVTPLDRPDERLSVTVPENASFDGAPFEDLAEGNEVTVELRQNPDDGTIEARSVAFVDAGTPPARSIVPPSLAALESRAADATGTIGAPRAATAAPAASASPFLPTGTDTPAALTSTPSVAAPSPVLSATPAVAAAAEGRGTVGSVSRTSATSGTPAAGASTSVSSGPATPTVFGADTTPFMGGTGSTGRAVDTTPAGALAPAGTSAPSGIAGSTSAASDGGSA